MPLLPAQKENRKEAGLWDGKCYRKNYPHLWKGDCALEKGLITLYEVLESRFSKRKPEAN
jgi:hypothetical protein